MTMLSLDTAVRLSTQDAISEAEQAANKALAGLKVPSMRSGGDYQIPAIEAPPTPEELAKRTALPKKLAEQAEGGNEYGTPSTGDPAQDQILDTAATSDGKLPVANMVSLNSVVQGVSMNTTGVQQNGY